MIISHEHKFIFVKTRKTAGTSMELALSKICGSADIITPLKAEDERMRAGIGGRPPQNYLERYLRYRPSDWVALLRHQERKYRFYNHIRAEWIRDRIGLNAWNSYFKFCFERNPWDKVISAFYWRKSLASSESDHFDSLDQFIHSGAAGRRYSDFRKYCVDGHVAMDFIGRYESIESDWHEALKKIGLREDLKLPFAKAGRRPDKKPYREVLTDAQKDRIASDFAREIEYFGYQY